MNSLLAIKQYGQQIWLDNLSRTLLLEGGLKRLIDEDGLAGVTSNPSIFHKAISESAYYKDDLEVLKRTALDGSFSDRPKSKTSPEVSGLNIAR